MTKEEFKELELDTVYYLWFRNRTSVNGYFYYCSMDRGVKSKKMLGSFYYYNNRDIDIDNCNIVVDYCKVVHPPKTELVKKAEDGFKQSRIDQIKKQITELQFEKNKLECGK